MDSILFLALVKHTTSKWNSELNEHIIESHWKNVRIVLCTVYIWKVEKVQLTNCAFRVFGKTDASVHGFGVIHRLRSDFYFGCLVS